MGGVLDKLKGRSEELDQQLLINWVLRTYGKEVEQWMHHSPNGGRRDGVVGAKMKAMGTRRGFPDLVLYVGRGKYVGLVVEMKLGKGRPSKEQNGWLNHLEGEGYSCHVCYGLDEGVEAISRYLELPCPVRG